MIVIRLHVTGHPAPLELHGWPDVLPGRAGPFLWVPHETANRGEGRQMSAGHLLPWDMQGIVNKVEST
jgi:hypothetical protein